MSPNFQRNSTLLFSCSCSTGSCPSSVSSIDNNSQSTSQLRLGVASTAHPGGLWSPSSATCSGPPRVKPILLLSQHPFPDLRGPLPHVTRTPGCGRPCPACGREPGGAAGRLPGEVGVSGMRCRSRSARLSEFRVCRRQGCAQRWSSP